MLWVATVLWWSIVLFSSGDAASGEFTRGLLAALGFEGTTLDIANLTLRKAGHVLYYAVLTGLVTRSFQHRGLGVCLALTTAVFDEVRQCTFASRTVTWVDLIYDGAGVTLGLLLDRRIRRG